MAAPPITGAGAVSAGAVDCTPCPYRARAWWGDRLLAESTEALRVDEADRPPRLYFPIADVRLEHLRDEGRTTSGIAAGAAALRSIAAPEGRDIMWCHPDGPPGLGRLSGLAAFDHDRVRVELVDAVDGDDPRDVTVKRFPIWGDASDLLDVLEVRPDGPGRYRSVTRPGHLRSVVEGSQLLAQAVVAAGRHRPGRRVVSGHLVFPRAADTAMPLEFELEEVSHGRSFTTVTVGVGQAERRCATGTLLLDVTAPELIRHAAAPPDVPDPYDCEPCDMSVTGRDIRVVEGAYTDDPEAPLGPPVLDAWVRFRQVPDDPCLHAALLAQFTGHLSIAAALRPHHGVGQRQAHRTLSTAINAIGLSVHRDVRADRWMLYHHQSTFAGDGMTHAAGRVHDQQGALLASFSVDAMVRPFAEATSVLDERQAL